MQKIIAFIIPVLFSGCLAVPNSFEADSKIYGDLSFSADTSALFKTVAPTIRSRCLSCHSAWTLEESFFVTSGLVAPGDPLGSMLYGRLTGTGGAVMPQGGALDGGTIDMFNAWIRDIPTSGGGGGGGGGDAVARRTAAYDILAAKCMSCHTDASYTLRRRFGAYDYSDPVAWEGLFVQYGSIVPNNANQSLLVRKLRGHGIAGVAAGNMPPTPAAALSAAEITALKDWIDQLL